MVKRKQIILIGGTIAFFTFGTFIWSTVFSANATSIAAPGSNIDPLVSASYVQEKTAALEAKIVELEAKVAALEKEQGKN